MSGDINWTSNFKSAKKLNNVPSLCTKLFQKRGHYSRGYIIQGGTLFKKIRDVHKALILSGLIKWLMIDFILICTPINVSILLFNSKTVGFFLYKHCFLYKHFYRNTRNTSQLTSFNICYFITFSKQIIWKLYHLVHNFCSRYKASCIDSGA